MKKERKTTWIYPVKLHVQEQRQNTLTIHTKEIPKPKISIPNSKLQQKREERNLKTKLNPAIDICGFTETFLTNLTDDARINVNGYNLFRKDRAQGAGSSILIYVLDKWNVIRRTDLESEGLETVWLEITFPNTKSLFVCYIYRPPNSPVAWYDCFSNELEKVSYLNCETILTGDFTITRCRSKWQIA